MSINYLGTAGVVSHTKESTTEYNRLLEKFNSDGMLSFFETWIDGEQLECFLQYVRDREREQDAAFYKNQIFSDVNGEELQAGDIVVMVDGDDLDLYMGEKIKKGTLMSVVSLEDLESNYITFSIKKGGCNLGLYGHRVAKLSI